jgi:beta-N-acetylglucosaminidase
LLIEKLKFIGIIICVLIVSIILGILSGTLLVKADNIKYLNFKINKLEKEILEKNSQIENLENRIYDLKFTIENLDENICNKNDLIIQYKDREKLYTEYLLLVSGILQDRIDTGDVRVQMNLSSKWFDDFFKNTPMEGLGCAITKAEREYGVNSLLIAATAAHESELGTSNIAQNKNNLFGFTAYDETPLKSATYFSSFEESIDKFAKLISREYLNRDGIYFEGYTIEDINKNYATDPNWSKGVRRWINKMLEYNKFQYN